MGNPATGCTCGSGAHPRECKLHPDAYRLHIAQLNVEAYLSEDPEVQESAQAAMDELNAATTVALQTSRKRNEALARLVFQTNAVNGSSYNLETLRKRVGGLRGGATDYEVWLRKLEWDDLQNLARLHQSAIDVFRYRHRFIQNEAERRHLHSSYGKHPAEFLFEIEEKS